MRSKRRFPAHFWIAMGTYQLVILLNGYLERHDVVVPTRMSAAAAVGALGGLLSALKMTPDERASSGIVGSAFQLAALCSMPVYLLSFFQR